MLQPRAEHTATLLRDGRVLVAGGAQEDARGNDTVTIDAELFDPMSRTWSATDPMFAARAGASAVLLDDGRVMVAGGETFDRHNPLLSDVELYDPVSATWTEAAPLSAARKNFVLARLSGGRVIAVGGVGTAGVLKSAEIWQPTSQAWMSTGDLNDTQFAMTGVLLLDGSLMVGGGFNTGPSVTGLDHAEIFDPSSGSWSKTSETAVTYSSGIVRSSTDSRPRPFTGFQRTLVGLSDGRVLSVGGVTDIGGLSPEGNTEEIFDPRNDTWTLVAPLLVERGEVNGVLLKDGRVFVVGGLFFNDPLGESTDSEIYSASANTWTKQAPVPYAALASNAILLASGDVLLTGGQTAKLDANLRAGPATADAAIFKP